MYGSVPPLYQPIASPSLSGSDKYVDNIIIN